MRASLVLLLALVLIAPVVAADSPQVYERSTVQLYIPAVGQNADGTLFGVASSLSVTVQRPGTGQVFLATHPLTQVDMQGSARLAVDTAGAITGLPTGNADYFFSVRTPSITIGGPSAGGAMAVAVTALLEGWDVHDDVVMTGMINPDGSIGPIGGQDHKLEAAASVHAKTFLVPLGQSTVVTQATSTTPSRTIDLKQVGRDKYGIDVREVADLYDAIQPFTGYALHRPEAKTDPLRDASYGNITRQLAENLTGEAQTRLGDLDGRYSTIRGELSQGGDRAVIDQQLALARQRLSDAGKAQNDSKQYLASSLAFQALVALDYAEALIAYHERGTSDVAAYMADYLSATDTLLTSVEHDIQASYPMPASRLDSQAAAEQRLLEAKRGEDDAKQAAAGRNYGTALQSASFARERAESARWWFRIGADVAAAAPNPTITESNVQGLIDKYQETVQLTLAYGSYIASNDPQFQEAQNQATQAQSAFDQHYWAAALLDLIGAIAQTNTALVGLAGPDPVSQRLAELAQAAAYQIELATDEGSPPIYAIALLELGNSRVHQDPVGAYTSYSTARMSARASLLAAGVTAPAPIAQKVPERPSIFGQSWVASPAILSGLLAVAVVAILLLIVWGSQNRYMVLQPAPPADVRPAAWPAEPPSPASLPAAAAPPPMPPEPPAPLVPSPPPTRPPASKLAAETSGLPATRQRKPRTRRAGGAPAKKTTSRKTPRPNRKDGKPE